MDCPTLPEVLGCWDYLLPNYFKGTQDYWVVQYKEMVALAMALKRCAIHPRMSPGMLCGVVQELCRCLTSVVQSGDLVNLKMLDVAENNPVASASEGRAPSPIPRVEPLVGVTAPSELSTLEPEEAA